MAYVNQCDAVVVGEWKKILEIEKLGLIMTTYCLVFEKGAPEMSYHCSGGRSAELVAFMVNHSKVTRPASFWKAEQVEELCRVGLVYHENDFLDYNLPENVKELIRRNKLPFEIAGRDRWGIETPNNEYVAYYLTDTIAKVEGIALVEKLNGGFKKARDLYAGKIRENAEAEGQKKKEERETWIKRMKSLKEL